LLPDLGGGDEAEALLAALHHVAGRQSGDALDTRAVHERAVAAAEVLDDERAAVVEHAGVAARDARIGAAAEAGHEVAPEHELLGAERDGAAALPLRVEEVESVAHRSVDPRTWWRGPQASRGK